MNITVEQLDQATSPEIATTLRNAGHAGAGGAGFPTHAKWQRLDETPYLLVNHQESEPNYVMDRWLGREYAAEFAELFEALLDGPFELIVVAAKDVDRDWHAALEAAAGGTVYGPDDLPLDPTAESGVVFAYTGDKYQFGMESVLMRLVADVVVRDELPMDHGWIVQNTETLYNVMRTLREGDPMTRKLVHVDGNVPSHRFLDVPIGTPASELLEAAGRPLWELDENEVIADGGPGWCFEIDESPTDFGVRKRTNCLLVLDEDEVAECTYGDGRINVLETRDWHGDVETEPTPLAPEQVRVPLVSNPDMDHVLAASLPVVDEGQRVDAGELIAVPGEDGISNAHHAPIDGTVGAISGTHVEITADEPLSVTGSLANATDATADAGLVYWTWCWECGEYVARPEVEFLGPGVQYVCSDCR